MGKTGIHTVYKNREGKRVPSVTTILGVLNKPFLLDWAWKMGTEGKDYRKVRDEAADAGTLAHAMILAHLKKEQVDTKDYSQETIDKAENSFLSYLEWEKGHKLEPLLIEEPLVSEQYQFGGTADYFGLIDGILTLMDFKTGKGLYDEYQYQLSAYDVLFVENGLGMAEQYRLLRINREANEAFEEKVFKELGRQWAVFRRCREIYQLQKELKGEKD